MKKRVRWFFGLILCVLTPVQFHIHFHVETFQVAQLYTIGLF